MIIRKFGCKRFEILASESLDRGLVPAEFRFMSQHREACARCRQSETSRVMALNMLRESAIPAQADDSFDRRLLRRARLQSAREQVSYWSPAAVGATVALVLVLAAVQLVSKPNGLPENNSPAGEARLSSSLPAVPDLNSTP